MPNVYSVDAAVGEWTALVELRGELYPVRDMTVEERLRKARELKDIEDRIEREVTAARERGDLADGDDDFETYREVVVRAVDNMLVGVPPDVSASLTEKEWDALTRAYATASQESLVDIPVRRATADEQEAARGKAAAPPR